MGGSEVQELGCGHFQKKFDQIQGKIQMISCMDELRSGMPIRGIPHYSS